MRRFFQVLLLILFITSLRASAFLDEEKKLEKIQEQLKLEKERLIETKQKEQEALGNLYLIGKDLKKAKGQLQRAKTKIAINESNINVLTLELRKSNEELKSKGTEFEKRMREIYKSSNATNYLEILFASKSMSDFINRSYYFSAIVEKDAGLIKDIMGLWQATKSKKNSLEQYTVEIKDLAKEIEEKKEIITKKAEEQKEAVKELQARAEEQEKKVKELEVNSLELERIIQQKVAERLRSGRAFKGGSGAFAWPLKGRLTSHYGYRRNPYWGGRHLHTGLDIAAPYGSPIRAADAGEIIFSGWWGGYGKAAAIDHGKGLSTVYGHMSRIYVQSGQTVEKGQIIGLVGSTGFSTGPHLHFEVRKNGVPTDPEKWL